MFKALHNYFASIASTTYNIAMQIFMLAINSIISLPTKIYNAFWGNTAAKPNRAAEQTRVDAERAARQARVDAEQAGRQARVNAERARQDMVDAERAARQDRVDAKQARAIQNKNHYDQVSTNKAEFLDNWRLAIQTAEITPTLKILQSICNHYRDTNIENIKIFINELLKDMTAIYENINSSHNIFYRYVFAKKEATLEDQEIENLTCDISKNLMTLPIYIVDANNIKEGGDHHYDLIIMLTWLFSTLNPGIEFEAPATNTKIKNLSQMVIDREKYNTIKNISNINTYKVFSEVFNGLFIKRDFLQFTKSEAANLLLIKRHFLQYYIPSRDDVKDRLNALYNDANINIAIYATPMFLLLLCMFIANAALLKSSEELMKKLNIPLLDFMRLLVALESLLICVLLNKALHGTAAGDAVDEAAMLAEQYLINARDRIINLVEDIAAVPIPNPVLLFRYRQIVAAPLVEERPVVQPARQRVLAMNYA